MALQNRPRPGRLAHDTERVIRDASREPPSQGAIGGAEKQAYTRQNVEAVDYGDARFACEANRAKVVSPARKSRRYLFILNVGAAAVNISFGKPATAATGIPLPTNGFYEPLVPPAGSVNAFSVTGTEIVVVEG